MDDSLLKCEKPKADVGYYLSILVVNTPSVLEVNHSLGQFDGNIPYVLNEQDKETNVMKPVEEEGLNCGERERRDKQNKLWTSGVAMVAMSPW